eukprot:gene7663-15685_t
MGSTTAPIRPGILRSSGTFQFNDDEPENNLVNNVSDLLHHDDSDDDNQILIAPSPSMERGRSGLQRSYGLDMSTFQSGVIRKKPSFSELLEDNTVDEIVPAKGDEKQKAKADFSGLLHDDDSDDDQIIKPSISIEGGRSGLQRSYGLDELSFQRGVIRKKPSFSKLLEDNIHHDDETATTPTPTSAKGEETSWFARNKLKLPSVPPIFSSLSRDQDKKKIPVKAEDDDDNTAATKKNRDKYVISSVNNDIINLVLTIVFFAFVLFWIYTIVHSIARVSFLFAFSVVSKSTTGGSNTSSSVQQQCSSRSRAAVLGSRELSTAFHAVCSLTLVSLIMHRVTAFIASFLLRFFLGRLMGVSGAFNIHIGWLSYKGFFDRNEIVLYNVVWMNHPSFIHSPYVLRIKEVSVSFDLLALISTIRFQTPITIDRVYVDGLEVYFERCNDKTKPFKMNTWAAIGNADRKLLWKIIKAIEAIIWEKLSTPFSTDRLLGKSSSSTGAGGSANGNSKDNNTLPSETDSTDMDDFIVPTSGGGSSAAASGSESEQLKIVVSRLLAFDVVAHPLDILGSSHTEPTPLTDIYIREISLNRDELTVPPPKGSSSTARSAISLDDFGDVVGKKLAQELFAANSLKIAALLTANSASKIAHAWRKHKKKPSGAVTEPVVVNKTLSTST